MSDGRRDSRGAERWLYVHDELLRALAHAISNRLATIAAAAGVLEVGVTPDARFLAGLQVDAERLEGLLEQLRQLPRRVDAALEPMLFTDALDGAKRLVEEHALLRGRDIRTVLVGDVMPVRAEPGAVQHAVAVALFGAARLGGNSVIAELETVGDVVQLTVRHDGAVAYSEERTSLRHDADAIEWLLAGSRGQATTRPDGLAVALPTLQASRRRTE